jgi:tetratricopeptide (TPR) repeat protein
MQEHATIEGAFTMSNMISVLVLTAALSVVHAQTKQPASSTAPMQVGMLAITSDHEGILFIDGDRKVVVSPGKIATLSLTAGQHFVDLRDRTGAKLWEKIISVPSGAQIAERINIAAAPAVGDTASKIPGSDLSRCDELELMGRAKESFACSSAETTRKLFGGLFDGQKSEKNPFELESDPASCSQGASGAWVASVYLLRCADELYGGGQYDKALAKANSAVQATEERYRAASNPPNQSAAPSAAKYLADAYVTRGVVKFALSDKVGARADIDKGLKSYEIARRNMEAWPPEPDQGFRMRQAFLRRSVVLFLFGEYAEALSDFNEFAAQLAASGYPQLDVWARFGSLLRQHAELDSRHANSRPSTQLTLGPERHLGSMAESGDTDIRREIDSIAHAGQYSPLPEAQISLTKEVSATSATRIVRNDTAYALHVLMSGPVDRKLDLPPGGSASTAMPPGSYRVAVRLDSTGVRPFYGIQVLEVGIEYTSQFFVK